MNIGKILKLLLLISGIAFTLTLAVIAYMIGNEPGSFIKAGSATESFIYDNTRSYLIFNDLIYESGKDFFRAYSLKDKSEKWELEQKLNDPVQTVLINELILFEKYGSRIEKIGKGSIVKTFTLENGMIYNVFAANQNLLGVICQKDGYKTSLILIDKTFTAVFERAYSEAYVADAVFIQKNILCILLNTSSGEEIRSYIEIVNINSGEVIYSKTLGNSLFLKTYRLNGSKTAIMSSREIYIIDGGYTETAHRTLGESDVIYDACITREGILLLIGGEMTGYDSLKKAKRIEFIDKTGNTVYSFDAESRLEKVDYSDGRIIGISSSDIFVFDTGGAVLYNTSSDDIIEKIIEYKKGYYFFHIDRIEKVVP